MLSYDIINYISDFCDINEELILSKLINSKKYLAMKKIAKFMGKLSKFDSLFNPSKINDRVYCMRWWTRKYIKKDSSFVRWYGWHEWWIYDYFTSILKRNKYKCVSDCNICNEFRQIIKFRRDLNLQRQVRQIAYHLKVHPLKYY